MTFSMCSTISAPEMPLPLTSSHAFGQILGADLLKAATDNPKDAKDMAKGAQTWKPPQKVDNQSDPIKPAAPYPQADASAPAQPISASRHAYYLRRG